MPGVQKLQYWQSVDPLTVWYDPDHFLYPEIFFTYAVESYKAAAKILVGYELFVGAAHPHDYPAIPLFVAGVATILTCALSDNLLGKYATILIGSGCLFVASFLHSIYYVADIIGNNPKSLTKFSLYFLLAYIATSGVRNVMLIEQIEDIKHLRSTIFILIFFRLIVRFATSLDVQFRFMTEILKWNAFIAVMFTMIYFILWMFVGQDQLPEDEERNVLGKCIACIFRAIFTRPAKNAAASLGKKPAESKSATSIATVASTKSERYVAHDSCLYRAYPKSTEDTIQQTIDLLNALPWVLPGIFMGNIYFYVMATTAYQVALLNYTPPLNYAFVKLYSLVFELPLYVIAYLLGYVRPFSIDLVPTMTGYLFVLLAAVAMMKVQSKIDAIDNIYLPRAKSAQIRVFNNIKNDVVIEGDWLDPMPVKLGAQTMVQRVVTVESPLTEKTLFLSGTNKTEHKILVYEKKTSSVCLTSYGLYNKKIPDRNNDPDGFADIMWFKTYNVSDGKFKNSYVNFTLKIKHLATSKITWINDAHYVNFFKVRHGLYEIDVVETIETRSRWRRYRRTQKKLYHILNSTTFAKNSLGTIITEFGKDGRPNPNALSKYYFLERTLKFRFILLIQIFLASIGNSLASASYYKFLYFESPSKLRSTLFGLVIGFDLLSVGFFVQFRDYLITIMWEMAILHSILYVLMFLLFIRRITYSGVGY